MMWARQAKEGLGADGGLFMSMPETSGTIRKDWGKASARGVRWGPRRERDACSGLCRDAGVAEATSIIVVGIAALFHLKSCRRLCETHNC